MVLKVNYDSLDAMCDNLTQQVSCWSDNLEKISTACQTVIDSSNMTGLGADAIREYMTNVHRLLQGLIGELLALHASNCLLYFDDYQYSVDSALHTNIDTNELGRLEEELRATKNKTIEIDAEVAAQLSLIKDIFPINYRNATDVVASHQAAIDHLTNLDESVRDLEARHTAADFTATGELIASLTAFIQEYLNQPRGSQATFSLADLANSSVFAALYAAHLSVSGELEAKDSMVQIAIQHQNERDEQLYIERQEETKAYRWGLAIGCAILSVALIAVSGGTATPLVVGAVSGVVGAVGAAGNNILDQYVEKGTLDDLSWAEVGKEAVIGGVVGFATGYVSAGISGAITDSVSKTVVGKALLGSPNQAVRIGTGAAIGGVSEVAGGMASRGVETIITTGDLGEAWENATDGKSILVDAALGAASGGYGEYKKDYADYTDWNNTSNTNEEIEYMKQMEADGEFQFDDEYFGPAEIDPDATGPADPSRRLATEKTGTIIGDRESGTFDFIPDDEAARQTMQQYGQETIHYKDNFVEMDPYTKHQTDWGEVDCQVEVGYMSDNRSHNYAQADEALAKKISAETGVEVTKADVINYRESNKLTWHEVQDRETMQLVPREIHESARHRGGVSQAKYEMAWGDVSIDDGGGITLPRADAKWDMGDALIDGTGEAVKGFSKIVTPKYIKNPMDVDDILGRLRVLAVG